MNYANTFNSEHKRKHNRDSHSQRTTQKKIFLNVSSPVSLSEIILKHCANKTERNFLIKPMNVYFFLEAM